MKLFLQAVILMFVFSSRSFGNPFLGLLDPACFVVQDRFCPTKNITFWLYTKPNERTPLELDPQNLNPLHFQPRRPVKILIHGYTGHRDFAPNIPIRPSYLNNKDCYVISMDYGPLVRYPCYFSAVRNLPQASQCLAQLINNLVNQNIVHNEDIHLIGFSLGAQLAGQTANYVNKPLKRITGLDPAKPLFILTSANNRLDKTDAEFVDVIHTDVLGRGMLSAMGHIDFYPNLGAYQPGCQEENADDPGSCNHARAPEFYAESINSAKGFWGYFCSSWVHYTFGLCYPNERQAIMGNDVNCSAKGSYFLKTTAASPFALGHVPYSRGKSHRNYYNAEVTESRFEPQLRLAFVSDAVKNIK